VDESNDQFHTSAVARPLRGEIALLPPANCQGPRGHILSQFSRKPPRDFRQDVIARHRSHGLVEDFEMIDVGQDQRVASPGISPDPCNAFGS
jgi:hypothetical protein